MTMIPTPVEANPSWGFPASQHPKQTQKHHTIFVRKTTHCFLHIAVHTYPHLYAPIVDLY
jgi:hypothetical protein